MELESFGSKGGVVLEDDPGGVITTALSENKKNSESKEMYSLTTSRAIVRHCVGLRLDRASCDDHTHSVSQQLS